MGLAESGRRVEILPTRARRPGRANVWSPILGRNPTWAPRGDRTATSGSVLSYPWGHPWPPWAARVGGVLWPGQCSLLEALPLSTQGHGLGWTHPLPLRVAVATARRTVLGRVAGSRNTGLQGRRKPRRHRGSRSTATGIRSPRSGPRYSQVWLWRLKAVPPRTALDRCDRGRRYRRFTDGVDLAIGRKLRRARGERD
jgi:hypothetical protein